MLQVVFSYVQKSHVILIHGGKNGGEGVAAGGGGHGLPTFGSIYASSLSSGIFTVYTSDIMQFYADLISMQYGLGGPPLNNPI